MAKETAKSCLLYVADETPTEVTAITISIDTTGGSIKIADTGSGLGAAKVGDQVLTSGFATAANNFLAIVRAAAAGELTVVNPIDPVQRSPVTPVDEAAGASVTVSLTSFAFLPNQRDTTYELSATTIDAGDKTNDNWGAQLAGTNTMTINAAGPIVLPNPQFEHVTAVNLSGGQLDTKIQIHSNGDFFWTPVSISQQQGGGDKDSMNDYGFTMANAGRAYLITAAVMAGT